MSKLSIGDHVWLDDPNPKKVHWIIEGLGMRRGEGCIEELQYANLRSGLTGIRKRGVSLIRLTLHTRGQADMPFGKKSKIDPAQKVAENNMLVWVRNEMQAEGLVQKIDGQLLVRDKDRVFMVEVTVHDVTGA